MKPSGPKSLKPLSTPLSEDTTILSMKGVDHLVNGTSLYVSFIERIIELVPLSFQSLFYKKKKKKKRVREKSRECHKPQPFPDTKRKRKQTKPNKRKSNKRKAQRVARSLFSKRGNRNAKRTEKHKNKITQCNT